MAVEKVTMVNVVGQRVDVNEFLKDIYFFNDIQLVNTMAEVEAGRFVLPVTEQNLDELISFSNIQPVILDREKRREYEKSVETLQSYYGNRLVEDPELIKNNPLDQDQIAQKTKEFIDTLNEKSEQLHFKEEMLEKTKQSFTAYSYLADINIPMRELFGLKNFYVQVGSLTEDNANRLRLIYPSIPSVLFHVGNTENHEQVFLVITAHEFKTETDRVLKALAFKEIEGFDPSYQGTPNQILQMLNEKENALEREIEVLQAVQNGYLKKTQEEANLLYNEIRILTSIEALKSYVGFSKVNFFFSGWLPIRLKEEFEHLLEKYPDVIILYPTQETDLTPPTKLRNNWLFRPFEELVKMYGMPNYKELDPTPFLSITYILCFGYMFGDVGQGIVLLLGGLYAEKKGVKLGGIAARIAIASIFFGFLYGSFFGNETILPTLWVKPMEDTMTVLIVAVVMGVMMLIVAYIYSLINKRREGNVEEEYFGKNGYSGFITYILILVVALMIYHYLPDNILLEDIIIGVIIILTLMVFLALPLTNIIKHRRFGSGVHGEYYVQSFFEVFEMYLSMLSNTLSFIRVGAFALTHVGMFMAFETIAEMAGGGIGGFIILLIANIFIIGFEGLIDCIQCLRLEFYELFGKYYEGDGIAFVTVQQEAEPSNSTLM